MELTIKNFFKKIKLIKEKNVIRKKDLSKQIQEIDKQIKSAEELGQYILVDKLNNIKRTIKEEQYILENKDITSLKYIYLSDLKKYIKSVENKYTKIVNLSEYDRLIPEENAKEIMEFKKDNIFERYIVVYNDISDKENDSVVKDSVERIKHEARDPVVFGCFYNKVKVKEHEINQPGEKLYFITEWEDSEHDISLEDIIEKSRTIDKDFEDIVIPAVEEIKEDDLS